MFSFIKWLENFLENIKKNKGLMFTILSIASVVGIFLSLYFVSFMVDDVADKTFSSEQKKFSKELKLMLNREKDFVLGTSTMATLDSELITLYQDDNNTEENSTKNFKSIGEKFTSAINKSLSRDDIKINFYITDKNDGDELINGIVVLNTGTYFQSKMPFATKDDTYLKVDVKSSIYYLKKLYKQEDRQFIYLLNDSSISKIDRLVFKKLYTKITSDYAVKNGLYSKETKSILKELNYKKLLKQGYIRTKNNFYVATKLYDTDGTEVGLALIGEKINNDSIVKLVKSLVNNVTMVALGLIVSMILFLF